MLPPITGRRTRSSNTAPDDYLRQVMTELKTLGLEHVFRMHCSGTNFIDLAKREMPDKLVLCATGSSFTLTA